MAADETNRHFSPFDLKRLESYANHMIDYHVILDLLPTLAALYLTRRMDAERVRLSGVQSAVLLALGLQRKSVDDVQVLCVVECSHDGSETITTAQTNTTERTWRAVGSGIGAICQNNTQDGRLSTLHPYCSHLYGDVSHRGYAQVSLGRPS